MANKQTETNWTLWIDNLSKILTALIAACGFVWGIIAFQAEQRTNETLEFRRKLWEKRLETYSRLSDVTGELITSRNNPTLFDSLETRFEHLYFSAMILVEDSLVEERMIAFKRAIDDYQLKRKSELYLKEGAVNLMKETARSLKRKQELLFDEK